MTATHTAYQTARMASLQRGFDVDVTPAQQLTGQELDDWLNAAEDRLFEDGLQDLRAMKQERERGYRVAA
jgi:hypothetical protein